MYRRTIRWTLTALAAVGVALGLAVDPAAAGTPARAGEFLVSNGIPMDRSGNVPERFTEIDENGVAVSWCLRARKADENRLVRNRRVNTYLAVFWDCNTHITWKAGVTVTEPSSSLLIRIGSLRLNYGTRYETCADCDPDGDVGRIDGNTAAVIARCSEVFNIYASMGLQYEVGGVWYWVNYGNSYRLETANAC